MNRILNSQRGGLDFLLSGIGSVVTAFSMGHSLNSEGIANLSAILIAVGTFFSYLIFRKFGHRPGFQHTVWLYVVAALASPFVSSNINASLPDGGFPRELMMNAAPLIWLIILGAWTGWTDSSLSFQSVPCIALFGLIGAFNTFPGATLTFFIFLVSAAMLYARSHQRHMLDRAIQSGFRHPETIREGPWRWMAGPEWAFGSATVIVLISLIGAPILRESVRNVAGVVSISAPTVRPPAPASNPNGLSFGERASIGTGPRGELSEEVVFTFKCEIPKHLRTGTFYTYDQDGWTRQVPGGVQVGRSGRMSNFTYPEIEKNFDEVKFSITFGDVVMDKFPAPFPFLGSNIDDYLSRDTDSSLRIMRSALRKTVTGAFAQIKPNRTPTKSATEPENAVLLFTNVENASPKILELAKSLKDPSKSDYENAHILKREIEKRAKYNLNAAPTPDGTDPVEHFILGPIREGYCDLFASSMVVMARGIGIPARYAVGYYPTDPEKNEEGAFTVRRADAHAWAELYFEEFGWVVFDPTEGAASVPGGERGVVRDRMPWYRQKWAIVMFWAFGGLMAAGIGVWLVRLVRPEQQVRNMKIELLQRSYEKFVAILERSTGVMRNPSMSPAEYFTAAMGKLEIGKKEADELQQKFIQEFYGPEDRMQTENAEFQAKINELKRILKKVRVKPSNP